MNIQIQLKPEIEARLIAQAATQGLSVEAYLESLIENSLISQEQKSFYQVSNQEEWETILTDLIESPGFNLAPPLSDAVLQDYGC
ncbi:hypothetical protein [Anabaena sp. 4-3]|uniref:hypothetical protein n=1 Tax=Anabaena sp. 4-3 TaxID=1811979 RepID=UPI00082DF07F|nr:hypothetical protein [Anabaena sp. 4-3]